MRELTFAILLFPALVHPSFGQAEPVFVDVANREPLASYRAGTGDAHGPGGVFTDLDNDGFPELVLAGGPGEPISLFRNLAAADGRRTFELSELPARRAGSTGAVAGDVDNDGDLDLYVLRHPANSPGVAAPNELWRNLWAETGQLAFSRLGDAASDPTSGTAGDRQLGLSRAVWQGEILELALTAAWADVDRDGDLDLYVGHHDRPIDLARDDPDPAGQRDVLYLNNNDGVDGRITFTDYTIESGATGFERPGGRPCAGSGRRRQCYGATNAVVFADLDNDRWPDLVVTNKMNNPGLDADMLYVNRGADAEGRWLGFENRAYEMTEFGHSDDPLLGTHNAMGVEAGDFDNDGDLDLYVTDADCARYENGELVAGCIPAPNNNLLINQLIENGGELDFVDGSLGRVGDVRADFSWGAAWLDADNDGRLDLHVATHGAAGIGAFLEDFLYLQDADGVFTDRGPELGVAQVRNARANLAADYDRDGAVDLFVVDQSDVRRRPVRSRLYENRLPAGAPGHGFLSLRLVSHPRLEPAPFKSTRDAIGARVTVRADGLASQIREVRAGSGNAASTSSLDLEFGLGDAGEATVEIAWPSGRDSTHVVAANQFLTISEQGFVGGRDIGEVGSVRVGTDPERVAFTRSFTDPVVFAGPPGLPGADASMVRLSEVGDDGFTLRIDEAPGRDGVRGKTAVSWIALEAGSWILGDGTRLEVGGLDTSAAAGLGQWENVALRPGLGLGTLVPVVVTQVQTRNDPAWVRTRQRAPRRARFQVALEGPEASASAHGTETVGWLAMEPARGLWSGVFYAAGRSRGEVSGAYSRIDFGQGLGAAPRFVAALASYNDRDAAGLRYRELTSGSVEVRVEEDETADGEIAHGAETVSFLVFGGDGVLGADPFVPNPRPTPDFVATCEGLVCELDASASFDDAPIPGYGYSWIFGDGDAGNGRVTRHTFAASGTYEIRLSVVDRSGQSRTLFRALEVAATETAR